MICHELLCLAHPNNVSAAIDASHGVRHSMAWVSTTWCSTAWVVHGMPHGATDDGVAAMPMGSELHAIVSKIMS